MQSLVEILATFNPWSVCFRLILAAMFGGCIGAERGRHGRPAGLRTYIRVCVGACVTSLIGLHATEILRFNGDPLRISAQVVSGIGFLGAGTIMSDQNAHITGLTTAAGLWTAATIGLAIGIGFYWGATIAFLIMLVAIVALSRLEKVRRGSQPCAVYYLEVNEVAYVNAVYRSLQGIGSLQVTLAKSGLPGHVGLLLSVDAYKGTEELLLRLQAMECVAVAIPTTL